MKQDKFLFLLKRVGVALCGKRWKRSLAEEIGVTERTLQNWLSQTYAASSDDMLPKLLDLLQQREKEIKNLIDEINRSKNL